jgi:uncharacterized membrane protein YagU involved in acid resistance
MSWNRIRWTMVFCKIWFTILFGIGLCAAGWALWTMWQDPQGKGVLIVLFTVFVTLVAIYHYNGCKIELRELREKAEKTVKE